MNRTLSSLFIPAVMLCAVVFMTTGCKTNEQNYRAAYLAAKEKADESSGIENTIYDRIRREAVSSRLVTEQGDSLPVMTVAVQCTPDGFAVPDSVKRYSLVVAQFKQVFNARSLATRMRQSGSWPNAMVLQTAEPLYYVVASTASTPEEIDRDYRRLLNEKSVAMKEPFPWILTPSRFPVGMGK